MKVFFLPRWFPVPHDPLWGVFVLRHAKAVQKYADVFVIYVDKTIHPDHNPKPEFVDLEGVQVLYWFYSSSTLPLVAPVINRIRMLLAYRRSWKAGVRQWGKPDINHVHVLTRMGVYAWVVKKLYGIPYVITEHWSRYLPENFYYKGLLRRMLTRLVVRGAGAVMPVTAHLASVMQRWNLRGAPYWVVPNVVDTDLFQPRKREDAGHKLTFCHISTFDDKAKNISGILRVMASLAKEYQNFSLELVGDGQDWQKMKRLAESLNLDFQRFRFRGAMPPHDVANVLGKSDYLLLFSYYENMPVVINEALACGVPVLATKVGGVDEWITENNGYLLDPGNENELASLLRKIIGGKPRHFGSQEIRTSILNRCSYEKVGASIMEIYNDTLKK